ncbi:MAG TPA: alpha-2-macroglobulin [Thermoanaerobaculia bacterium]|nr:alpha-2-macroglobulin [Thermoanaerobaculia bacterium]
MSEPSSAPRDKRPSRFASFFRRKWQGKDVAIAVLGLLFVSMSAYAFRGPLAHALAKLKAGAKGGETVGVFEVIVDRENRQYFDVLFDKPVGQGKVGDVLDPAPAKIFPTLGGSWKWKDTNALRFQASGGLPVASEFKVQLDPDKIVQKGQVFTGDTEFTVRTDKFLVEDVTVNEEPALEGKNKVILRGEMKFNYAVEPKTLAPLVKLVDPDQSKPVGVALEIDYQNRSIGYRTEPIEKKKEARKVKLTIAGTLTPAGGNVPLGEDSVKEIEIGSSTTLTVRGVEAQPGDKESSLKVTFSSPISAAVAEKYVKLDPAVKVQLSAEQNVLTLTGELEPGSSYTLTIAKGMPATDDAVLQEDYSESVDLPDLEPKVRFQSQGMFLWNQGKHAVALEAVNVPSVKMTIDRVYLNNLFFLFAYGGFNDEETGYFGELNHALGDRLKEETLNVGGKKNKKKVVPLSLDKYVNTKEPGLYRVSVGKPDDYEAAQRWLLLTDLGAVAKRGNGEFLVWVSSLKDLAAVGDAKVTLISDQNQTLASGRTDSSGLWRVKDKVLATGASGKAVPYMVTIEKGDDFSFLLLNEMSVDTTGLDVGGAEAVGSGYTAFLYGERDLYRPGETAHGLAIVRDGALHIPPSMPALLRHRDPQGRELGTQRITTDAKGLSPFELELPAYSLTGSHTLELEVAQKVIGQYRFHVEEFVPDRISVAIAAPKEKVGPGQVMKYTVASDYLFGAPAAGLPVETRVRLVDSTFAPKGFEGFSFRNDERKLDDKDVFSQQGKLDDAGRSSFEVTMPAGTPVPSSLEAVLTARVQEQGGRGVAALERLQVHPYPYYIGLRRTGGSQEGFADPGKEASFEFVAVSPEGKEVPSGGLRADLFQDRWNTVLRKTSSGGWRYETTRDPVLIASKAVPAGKSKGSFTFTPKIYGSYRVTITDPATQASSEVEFYAAGWGTSPWAIKNPSRLELDLDKTEYAPGETATLQVRAPFPGKILLTVEREGVLDTQIVDLPGNTGKISVPVRGEYRPNAYVTATLVRKVGDLETGSAGRAFGAVPIAVNRNANHLAPQIAAPDQMRPNRDLAVTIKAVPNAVVTLAAVDEGILQLIAQKTPEPFDFFYRKLALGVTSYDTFSLLLPELKNLPAGGGEGAEGRSQYVRTEGIRRVKPVAFWSGPVVADAQGNAKVTFKVPEFQGALRLMAVAIDNDRFGSSFRLTRVRDPLVLLPTLPRILAFGETLQVPVTVRNDTGKAGPVTVALAAVGAATVEKPSQAVDIPVGREKTVYFTVKTGTGEGIVKFVATASGNGEQSKSTTEVPIRSDLPEITAEDAGQANTASVEIATPNADQFQPGVKRTLRIGAIPLVQFAGKLEHLLHYPYGCLEQTTSSVFPLIYIADIAKALEPSLLDPKNGHGDPADMVQAGLRRIATMQLGNGGFSLWQGGREVHPWGSVYATHFLVEAKRAGHPVSDSLYRNALAWLASEVKAKNAYGSEELERMVYGLYVLARAGKADLGTMDFIRQKHLQELSSNSKAMLAAAYASVGNPKATSALVAMVGEVQEMKRQTGGNFDSAIRNRSLLLLALLDAAPKDPRIPSLIDRLARDARTVYWWTTQEESFTLLALGQFIQRQQRTADYSGTLFVGGKKAGTFDGRTATFRNLPPGPVKLQMNAGYKPGAAFYSLTSRGVPKDEVFKPAKEGLEIERQFLTRDNAAVNLNDVKQGDLVVIKTRVRSVSGPIQNVVIVNLLPSGLEVENPRLSTTEQLPWVTDANLQPAYMDLRDDRILLFTDLPADSWQTFYTLVRAVAPGKFHLPPVQAEAMYDGAIRATGERGEMEVKVR